MWERPVIHFRSLPWVALVLLLALDAAAWEPTQIEFLITPDRDAVVADVEYHPGWQSRDANYSLGFVDDAVWLRLDVPSGGDFAMMTLSNAWIDDVTVYMLEGDAQHAEYRTGDQHPFSSRPVRHPTYAFPIPTGTETIYLRDVGMSAVFYPIALQTAADYQAGAAATLLLRGAYYGVLLLVLCYSMSLFVMLRDRFYAYFCLYGVSLWLTFLTADGLAQQYLVQANPPLLQTLSHSAIACTVTFVTLFLLDVLNVGRQLPRMARAAHVFIAFVVLNGLVLIVARNPISQTLEVASVVLGALGLMAISITRWRQGSRLAPVIAFATGSMALGGIVFSAVNLGWLPNSLITRNAAVLGSTIEILLLSVALALRLRAERRQRDRMRHRSWELARRVRELQAAAQLADEHRGLQKSMQHAQKLKTIGQLTGGFAHEFNNILASILGFTQLAEDQANNAKVTRYLSEVHRAADRAADLVSRLMAYSSRAPETEQQENDLVENVAETVLLLQGSLPATVQIETAIDIEAAPCTITRTQVRDLLINLCLNASEAMQHRGHIRISLNRATVDDGACASCMQSFDGDYFVLSVIDGGHGLDGQVQDIFTPFYTTKPVGQGAGLGLSVVHGIVHEQRGHIVARAADATGTRFDIFLPTAGRQALPAATERRILLIEDDQQVARYLEALLTNHDYEVTVAGLPSRALLQFMQRPDDFDLVITDQQMPEITGLEIAREIHAVRNDLPIILTSGDPNRYEPADLAVSGIRDVFGKPIESERLLARIAGLLRTPQPV